MSFLSHEVAPTRTGLFEGFEFRICLKFGVTAIPWETAYARFRREGVDTNGTNSHEIGWKIGSVQIRVIRVQKKVFGEALGNRVPKG